MPGARMAANAVTIYSDGACLGNPGPGGYGTVLLAGPHRKELSAGYRRTTNNRMELMGAIAALEALKKPSNVRLHTDSKYVQNGITSWIKNWKKRGWKTADNKPVANVDLWQRLEAAGETHDIEWLWVKGHDGDVNNERADELAREAIKAVRAR